MNLRNSGFKNLRIWDLWIYGFVAGMGCICETGAKLLGKSSNSQIPHSLNSEILKFLCLSNGDPNLDMDRGLVRRMEAEVKPGTVIDAWWDRDPQPAWNEGMTTTIAPPARFSPCFASAATFLARRAKKDHDRDDGAPTRFTARQADLGLDRLGPFARAVREERSAHTRHEVGDRRKIDRDLISEAIRLAFKSHAG